MNTITYISIDYWTAQQKREDNVAALDPLESTRM